MKILSPAGNFESLKMAVINGADEVYLGINDFNARNNIDGFTMSNLQEAVDYAHLHGVKVLLAINILLSDDELGSALDIIVDSYNIGIDAFIIQDLALASLVKENYPEIEIHASTQMGIHNLEGVKAVEKLGFKRVVLARETPLEEIKRIKQNTDVEIEYFAHGALCVSFSGNCYLSSYFCSASGNRGKCKQLCRLPYTLEKDGKILKKGYLLSAKDFNMSKRLKEMEESGVDVLKIEGRARRPFYVAMATREYYNALHNSGVNEENFKLAFNRNFTEGYFNGNGQIISNIQNHIGIYVGKVEKVIKGRRFNEVFFTSKERLSPKSTFKFFSLGKEISTVSAYDISEVSKGKYRLTTTQIVNVGDEVRLILDARLEEETLKANKKREILVDIYAEIDKKIKATIKVDDESFIEEGEVCQQALKQPITKENLIENFAKSDMFDAKLNVKILDNIFMSKQALNEFRRKVFDKAFEMIVNKYRHNLKKKAETTSGEVKSFEDFQIVEEVEENFTAGKIIYSPETYNLEKIEKFMQKCEEMRKKPFLDTPNFALKKDIELLKEIIEKTKIAIIANNYYALTFDTEIIIGAGLNVYNSVTAEIYGKAVMTAESDVATRINFPYMTLRHCPMKCHLGASCDKCPYGDGYTYKMDDGRILKLKRKKLSTCTFYLC